VSGSIAASFEIASADRSDALHISSVNSATGARARQALLRKQEVGRRRDRPLPRVSDSGRTVAMRSLEDAGRVEAVGVIGAGCRGANPIAKLQDRIMRRVRPPPVGAVKQRRRQRPTRDGRREEGRQS
jgi:hypothetical protein